MYNQFGITKGYNEEKDIYPLIIHNLMHIDCLITTSNILSPANPDHSLDMQTSQIPYIVGMNDCNGQPDACESIQINIV